MSARERAAREIAERWPWERWEHADAETRKEALEWADAVLGALGEPVAWRVEIECPGGPYIEHWDASRRDRAWAQFQKASEAGDEARMIPLYAYPDAREPTP